MSQTILTINGVGISLGELIAACGAVAALVLGIILVMVARGSRRAAQDRASAAAEEARRNEAMEPGWPTSPASRPRRRAACRRSAKVLGGRQAELARVMAERLDAVSTRHRPFHGRDHPADRAAAAKPATSASRSSTMPRRTWPSCRARSPRCATCSATSRRAAPSARPAWRRSSRTALPKCAVRVPAHAVQQHAAGLRDLPARPAARS